MLSMTGFHLCQRLLNEGIEVIGVDDKKNAHFAEEQLLTIGRNANLNFIDTQFCQLENIKIDEEIDVIFHTPDYHLNAFYEAMNKESDVKQICSIAHEKDAKVIFQSTYEVYGNLSGEVSEENKTNPKTPLGVFIDLEEKRLINYKGIHYMILRFPMIFGPWDQHGIVLESIENKGKQRGLLYVDDAVSALQRAAEKNITNDIYNIPSCMKTEGFKVKCDNTERILQYKKHVKFEEGLKRLYTFNEKFNSFNNKLEDENENENH
jgi:UDP-glucose 4-epimerase